MAEDRPTRLRRLRMRSIRRGIREMDLILGAFCETALESMPDADLAAYEALLAENDHELFRWITGQSAPPASLAPLVERITGAAGGQAGPL
jgi:antitoxin CptB